MFNILFCIFYHIYIYIYKKKKKKKKNNVYLVTNCTCSKRNYAYIEEYIYYIPLYMHNYVYYMYNL